MVILKAFGQQLSLVKISLFLDEFSHVKVGVLPASVMSIVLTQISLWNIGICRLRTIIELSQGSGCTLPNSLTLTGAMSTGTGCFISKGGIQLTNALGLNCQNNCNWFSKATDTGLPSLLTLRFQTSKCDLANPLLLGCQVYWHWDANLIGIGLPSLLVLGCQAHWHKVVQPTGIAIPNLRALVCPTN